jgi:hypothetical protein
MGKRRSSRDAALAGIYAQVPSVHCKGLCQEACGPIDMTPREDTRIRDAGVDIPQAADAIRQLRDTGDYACPALDAAGRCSVYEVRPLICRLWGAVEELRCPHGCVPDGGWLSDSAAMELMNVAFRAGGAEAKARPPGALTAKLDRNPGLRRALQQYVREARL